MRLFVLDRKNPVDWIKPSTSSGSACARSSGVGYFANRAGVTMLTRSSVVCADRIVATSSSYAFECSSAQRASGYASRKRRTTSVARARAPRGRAMHRGYPRPVAVPALTPVPPEAFASIRDTVERIEQEASRTDAHPWLGETVWVDLAHPRSDSAAFLVDANAFAHVARSDNIAPRQWEMGMTLTPAARDGEEYSRLSRAVIEHVATHGGGRLVYWVFDAKPDHDRRLGAEGFEPKGDLFEMHVALPLAETPKWPDGVSVRPFQPGRDEHSWLVVNNRAFAGHPEQGGWTEETLARRMAEPWFDPELFLLAFDDDGLAGFNWLKIHESDPTPDASDVRLRETYVH